MSPRKNIQTLPDSQKKRSYVVPRGSAPARLDSFLRKCFPHLSLREIREMVGAREVVVNGRLASKGRMLFAGDAVSFTGPILRLENLPVPNADIRVEVLYEDEVFVVLDKPAGVACHALSGTETRTLANYLSAHYPFLIKVGKSPWEPGLVHRLDRDTSGLVLVTKDQASFENLRAQFRRQLVRKEYAALVWGRTPDQGVVSHFLAHDPKDKRKMRIIRGQAKPDVHMKKWKAVTRFQTLSRSKGFSFIRIEMYTGVTHQIRAHLEAAGFPLVGDPLYSAGAPVAMAPCGRQFLHACRLELLHPRSGRKVIFESPLAEDLMGVLDRIGIRLSKLPYP